MSIYFIFVHARWFFFCCSLHIVDRCFGLACEMIMVESREIGKEWKRERERERIIEEEREG